MQSKRKVPIELNLLILVVGMVILPNLVLSYKMDIYTPQRNLLGGIGIAVSLCSTVYASYCLARIRKIGLKEKIRQCSLSYRIYQCRNHNKKNPSQKELVLQRGCILGLLTKAIVRTMFIFGVLWGILEQLMYAGKYEEAILPGIFLCLIGIVVIWIRFRTERKRQIRETNQYAVICNKAQKLAQGSYGEELGDNLGKFNPLRDSLNQIEIGLKSAVEEAVRSQTTKTQLITNVSHDLKTPLTSIVSYVDLLKRKDLNDEEKREYIEILDQKSQRLKVLIEDLFEMSKAASKNLPVSYQELNLVALTREVLVEQETAFDKKALKLNLSYISDQISVQLDGQKMYRILGNLVTNITKYAMPNTRVYVAIMKDDKNVYLEFKNISAVELTYQGEELMERFVREDRARTTEGSGLGLAIAKSLVELQNGTMKVDADADLFRVRLTFPLVTQEG